MTNGFQGNIYLALFTLDVPPKTEPGISELISKGLKRKSVLHAPPTTISILCPMFYCYKEHGKHNSQSTNYGANGIPYSSSQKHFCIPAMEVNTAGNGPAACGTCDEKWQHPSHLSFQPQQLQLQK